MAVLFLFVNPKISSIKTTTIREIPKSGIMTPSKIMKIQNGIDISFGIGGAEIIPFCLRNNHDLKPR